MLQQIKLPLVLRPDRRKRLFITIGALALAGSSILLFDEKPEAAIFVGIFFGLATIVLAISFHPRASYLELTEQGFTFAALFRQSFVPWCDVQGFQAVSVERSFYMVGWNYAPSYQRSTAMRKFAIGLAGVEAALPDTYGFNADQLAVLLNDLRSRYGTSENTKDIPI